MNATGKENLTKLLSNTSDLSCKGTHSLQTDFQVVLMSILIIVSIIGNILVIFVVIRNKRMHSVANYLICNMCIADLLITFLPMIWEVIALRHFPDGTWPMGKFMCSFTYMCIYLSVSCSILSLMIISIDRFFAVLFPLKQYITFQKFPFILLAIWIVSFAFASPTTFAQNLYTDANKTYCIEIWKPPFDLIESPKHYTVILFLALYATPITMMAVLYTTIVVRLWRRNIPGNRSSRTDLQALKQKRKVIKMLVCVVTVFAICWFPIFFAQFLYYFDPTYISCPYSFPKWLQFFAFFMQYLGSATNPFIYFTFSKSYRVGFGQAVSSRINRMMDSQNAPYNGSSAMTISHGKSLRRETFLKEMSMIPEENGHRTGSRVGNKREDNLN